MAFQRDERVLCRVCQRKNCATEEEYSSRRAACRVQTRADYGLLQARLIEFAIVTFTNIAAVFTRPLIWGEKVSYSRKELK